MKTHKTLHLWSNSHTYLNLLRFMRHNQKFHFYNHVLHSHLRIEHIALLHDEEHIIRVEYFHQNM